jgi:hypothetical protein
MQNTKKNFKDRLKKGVYSLYIIGLVGLPIVLLALPASHFDHGQTLCLSVLLLDVECYACGMTRAIQHMIHLEIETAYGYNKLSFIVLPVAVVVWLSEIKQTYHRLKPSHSKPNHDK